MHTLLVLALVTGPACVIDRTGQSAVSDWKRQLALQETRISDFDRRLGLLESSLRARGRQEAEKMDDLEGVRAEVRRLRGELELSQHRVTELEATTGVVRDEADIRLEGLGTRLAQLEAILGLEMPATAVSETQPTGAEDAAPPLVPLAADSGNPDDLIALAGEHLAAGRAPAARAVLARYIDENPQSPRVLEARFQVAETWFAEGAYQQAVLAYEDVVQADTASQWAPRSMLRQGECFQALGRTDEARLFWEDLVARYPRSQEASRARDRLDSR